jgi:hypothetical protein
MPEVYFVGSEKITDETVVLEATSGLLIYIQAHVAFCILLHILVQARP